MGDPPGPGGGHDGTGPAIGGRVRVIIIGAGIAGLTTALALHAAGVPCTVHERAAAVEELGVGINLLPHAVAPLTGLGLLDRLRAVAVETGTLVYAHRLGPEIMRRPCGLASGAAHPQFSIHRGALAGVLHAAVRERLGPGAVRTDHRLVGVEQDPEGVTATFADGTSERADALIGADGIRSAVRAGLYPDEGLPCWNGVLMWRGAVEWPALRDGRTVLIAGGTDSKLVLYPIGPGRHPDRPLTNWAVCTTTGRAGDPPPRKVDWSATGRRTDLRPLLDAFHVPDLDLPGLVAATPELFEYPMCDRDPLPRWSHGRVTLLGDAAHPMYPMGSNGAAQAILDAMALADCLSGTDDAVPALGEYDEQRRTAANRVVVQNRAGGPERIIDEVERRAPAGFVRRSDVLTDAELDQILADYARASTGSPPR
jgi:2-polyprenyl-6-methoxyphenol hydroxylase-like FAD-dependent oxidoreductase